MENLQIGIEFTPHNRGLLAFLKDLEKALSSLQFDGSKISMDDLQKQLQATTGNAENLLPVFRLLGKEIEGIDGAEGLDFSDAIGDARKQITALIDDLEGEQIALPTPEFEGKISVPEIDIPSLEIETPNFVDSGDLSELDNAKEKLEAIDSELADIAAKGNENPLEKFFQFEAIGQAGEFLSGIAEQGQEAASAMAKLQTSASATGVSFESLQDAAAELFIAKGAESYADAIEKIAVANRFLGDTFKGKELAEFTTGLSAISGTLGTDLEDTIKKSSTFVKGFGVDGKQAYDLLALGSQKAITSGDDFVDVIGEYSPLMKEAGFSAEEFVGTLVKVGKDGTFNLDKVGDAIKETQIRLNAGDIGNAFKDLGDIPPDLGDKLNAALEKATKGQISVKDFLVEATAATNEANLSDAMKTKIQTAISGTPAEEIGHELYGKLFGQKVPVDQIREDAILAGEQVRQSLGDTNIFSDLSAGATVAFQNIAASVAPILAPLGGILSTTSQIAPALSLLDGKFAIFSKFGGAIKDVAAKILSMIPALVGQTAATGAATTATAGLNATMLLNPAFLIIAGIAALVGAFVLFSDSTKDAETAVNDVNNALDDFKQKTEIESLTVKQSKSLRDLATEYENLKSKTDPESQKRFAEVSEELASRVPSSVTAIENLGAQSEATAKRVAIATDEVRSLADENERLAKEAKAESLENLGDQAAALADSYKEAKEKQAELREDLAELRDLEKAGLGDTGSLEIAGNPFDTIKDDLKDTRAELGAISGDVEKAESGMRNFVKQMMEGGKSTEEVAEMLGITVDEVKRFSGESVKGKVASKGIATEVKGVSKNVDEAKKKTEELAGKFSEARKQAADFSGASIGALAQALIDLEAAKKSGDTAAIARAEEEIKVKQKAAQESVKLSGSYDKIFAQAERLAGKTKPETVAAVTKEITDAAKVVNEILSGLNNELELQAKQGLEAELEKIAQAEEKEIASIKTRGEELRKAQKDKGVTVQNADEIKELEEGGKVIVAAQQKFNNERAKVRQDFYTKQLTEQGQFIRNATTQEIAEIEASEALVTGNTEEALQQRLELRLRKLALQQSLEIQTIVEGNEEYISAYTSLQTAIASLEKITAEGGTEEQRIAAEEQVKILRKRLRETEETILASDKKIKLIDQKFENETSKSIEEIKREGYEREKELLEESLAFKAAKYEEEVAMAQRLVDDITRITEEAGTARIDTQESEALALIEREKELRIITEEEAQRRITEAQKKGEEQRAALAAQATGARLEAERQAALARLREQEKELQERLKLAQDNGQTEEANRLTKELEKIGKEIEEKGNFVVGISSEIQTKVTEIFSNLFAGDAEKIKQPFRLLFQTLVGALTRLASAVIAQTILTSITPVEGFTGLLKGIALFPIIEGLVSGLLTPITAALLSFPTGGAVQFDQPTLVQVGDGARLGGINREYIFRDDQLRTIVQQTAVASSITTDKLLNNILHAVEKIPDKMVITEEAIWVAQQRQKILRNS